MMNFVHFKEKLQTTVLGITQFITQIVTRPAKTEHRTPYHITRHISVVQTVQWIR